MHRYVFSHYTLHIAHYTAFASIALALSGCATPQYAVRPAPVPEETTTTLQIERAVSRLQAETFEQDGARLLGTNERISGLPVQATIERLRVVTERPHLPYRALLYEDTNPNAAALADGRIYFSTGMLAYLKSRGSRESELAAILGHELAHTVAQHLVKRYRLLQQQQAVLGLVAAGASLAATHGAGAQQASQLAVDAASLLANVAVSGFSQEHELEADQLGIRYVIRAGFDPLAALDLLEDFQRFDAPWPFLRTHPYVRERRAQLARFLIESGHLAAPAGGGPGTPSANAGAERLERLRQAQTLYPAGSISWRNLQQQIDRLRALNRSTAQ